ncbi:hypothetical protein [Agromyces bracchium]|uniref:Uncharacterized protein n=1 Tax=Agromyces bracchium TaxID=88376 RepID=A0A6I3M8R7_9MICO|nr:hypothetical protein [Agromyces bracchium]MTH68512.1 hypothetical protein [Agromyces bracchium]
METGATAVGTAVIPIVVAVLTIVGAVVSTRIGAGRDDLRRAEQLTAVLAGMSPSPERDLVEQVRDDHASAYALRASAPRHPGLRLASLIAEASGIAVVLIGAVYVLLAPGFQPWFWATYVVGAALVAVGLGLGYARTERQRDWIASERDRRHLPPPAGTR